MSTTSVKHITGLDPERTASNAMDPSDWAALFEELDLSSTPEWVDPDHDRLVTACNLKGREMIEASFGKYTSKGFDGIAAKCDAELAEMAAERGWDITPEERLASLVSVIQRAKELEAWKVEQKAVHRAKQFEAFYKKVGTRAGKPVFKRFYTSHNLTHTEKAMVDGKLQWQDAMVRELPPPKVEDVWVGKTKKRIGLSTPGAFVHEDARYILKLPDGRKVDLGMTDGKFKPVRRNDPNKAMQSIAARLGMKVRGGAHTILQTLLGRTDILPAYTSFWYKEGWVVIVGWQLDPKLTNASYMETLEGKLVRSNTLAPDAKRLTISETEYAIISKPSIGEADEDLAEGNCTMELDSDLTMQGFERDGERFDVDADQFQNGLVLLESVSQRMGRYVDMMCGEPTWELPGFRLALAEIGRELLRERKHLKLERLAQVSARTQAWLDKDAELAKDLTKSIGRLQRRIDTMLSKWRAQVADMWAQLSTTHANDLVRCWFPNERSGFAIMRADNFVKETVKVIPGADKAPLNIAIAPPRLVYDVARVIPSLTPMQVLQARRSGVVERQDGYTTRMLPKRPVNHVTPKTCTNRLKAVLSAMMAGESPLHA